ncbi:AAA family ATPase [Plectosphaerella plurivora]|uniref:AAA family ATPase n=1 Tax=Plectosphaerella plurivora TaxID=936078 RepID=A0A9P8VL75_9PEZI|nr:AAA family ATPase [Plectosphaerella plurivora]
MAAARYIQASREKEFERGGYRPRDSAQADNTRARERYDARAEPTRTRERYMPTSPSPPPPPAVEAPRYRVVSPSPISREARRERIVHPRSPVLQISGGEPDDGSSREDLLRRIEQLSIENAKLAGLKVPEPIRPEPYRWSTVHFVSRRTCLEEPSWIKVGRDRFILKGQQHIRDVDDYVSRHPEVVFVWLKWYDDDASPDFSTSDSEGSRGDILPRPQAIRQSVQITHSAMRSALDTFLDLIPGFESDAFFQERSNDLNEPSLLCFQIRDSVDAAMAQLDNDLDIRLMELFWDWAVEAFAQDWHRIDSEFSSGLVSPFSIKHLFQPGEVIVSAKGQLVAYIATTWAVPSDGASARRPTRRRGSDDGSPEPINRFYKPGQGRGDRADPGVDHWSIACWSWGFDGNLVRHETWAVVTRDVFKHNAPINITSLNFYPLRCGGPELREQLVKRGQNFESCRQRRLVSLTSIGSASTSASSEAEAGADRYMVDVETYGELRKRSEQLKRGKSLVVHEGEFEDHENEGVIWNGQPEGEAMLVFPNTIIGYDLRRKIWIDLEVDRICDVSWNSLAFESLAIDADDKELVQALVTNQIEASKGTDIITDKGTGLIILLHGGPGTGKTFTAESLADLARKPLYRVTCGDIGTNAEQVEKYLESVLHLGRVWDCVVLLDEADVFLEERSREDLARNALVSVFLRILEYYHGILILTSNRVATFDEAFKSRVQLALHYRPLESWQRRKIWRNFIERLRRLESRGEVSINFDDINDHMEELVNSSMNGRQIRNAVTSARQLALYRREALQYKHLRHVIAVAAKFEAYSLAVNEGLTDDDIARDGRIR